MSEQGAGPAAEGGPPSAEESALRPQQVLAHSLTLAMQNAVAYQQMVNTVTVAITAQLANGKVDPEAAGLRAALDLLASQAPTRQLAELTALLRQVADAAGTPGDQASGSAGPADAQR